MTILDHFLPLTHSKQNQNGDGLRVGKRSNNFQKFKKWVWLGNHEKKSENDVNKYTL